MSKLEEEAENWERDCRAWNLPRPRTEVSLPEDLLRSLKESVASRTDEPSSQRPTQGTGEV
jgi:hypothetical protein